MVDEDGWRTCHFCGTYVKDDKESDGTPHAVKDCRPDLVEHSPGPDCTWSQADPPACYWNHETNTLGNTIETVKE